MATPVLWRLEVSHFNEKARWALDYKKIAHVRRAVLPPEKRPPAAVEFRDSLKGRPGFEWVLDMYERHRGTTAEIAA